MWVWKTVKHCTCKEGYACNPGICGCECDKDCNISEYLKDFEGVKSLVDDLVVRSDETEETQNNKAVSILE